MHTDAGTRGERSADEHEIRALHRRMLDAWEAGDGEAFAAPFSDDALFVGFASFGDAGIGMVGFQTLAADDGATSRLARPSLPQAARSGSAIMSAARGGTTFISSHCSLAIGLTLG
jgi:Domain of unknown function (DUF4440)